jgi:ribosomal protein S18 acetylase RimI-like enzyme
MTKRWIEIREAVDADLPDIISMWGRNIKTVNTASDIVTLYRYFKNYFLVATHAGMGNNTGANSAIIGFVAGAVRDGHGHISGIAVDKEYRKNGVGKRLLEAADVKFHANGFHRVTLEVRISNRGAIGFYKALGYKSICTITGYYADGEDAIVYELKI